MRYLIIGLGNPGPRYAHTRHNAGFLAVDDVARTLGVTLKKKLLLPLCMTETMMDGKTIILATPTTFMNCSGKAVRALVAKYRPNPAGIIVLSDDVALPLGSIRVRQGGSAGGHNGLKSVIAAIGEDFVRVRIGVGNPPAGIPLETYVLQPFGAERDSADAAIQRAADLALHIVRVGPHEQTVTMRL